jgi:CheY-like chemotaxis protein
LLRQLKPRILCIDDEIIVGEMLRRWLEKTGDFHVECETDAFDALDSLRMFKPDLVIMDINMPGRDGLEVARQLREEPWIRHRPIIFYSGMTCSENAALKASGAGPAKFLQKGVPLGVLEKTARELLAERLILYHAFKALEGKQGPLQI